MMQCHIPPRHEACTIRSLKALKRQNATLAENHAAVEESNQAKQQEPCHPSSNSQLSHLFHQTLIFSFFPLTNQIFHIQPAFRNSNSN